MDLNEKETVSRECLGCICEAASGCNTTLGCTGDICGAFHITWGYWADAGKPTLPGVSNTDLNAYSSCANNVQCAGLIVEGYMKKYAKDCDNDGVINCNDYVRIHYLGASGCSGALESKYENAYNNCQQIFI
ncbi:PREDICTED: lysozyme 2-like [Ceratosolen solmsi marchali]|uniref:lysozyme n=1 Tax=Ceratosolen solmsi marchali TaxID=326594 RepID=A0AAJ6YWH8_9HYME|nr:PREDICTED: lysozyme 2-like [Ceratosolen solmsi marchali]